MDRAINKSTGKLVSAFEIFKNGSYQNLTKGEWIAPKDSISNWDECTEEDTYVHYTKEKEYDNYRSTHVLTSPHFAIYPGSKANTVPESPMHKMLKDWLFNRLASNDLEILFSKGVKPHKYENKYLLTELDINWNDYSIEVTTKGSRNLRADILLPFYHKHILLGEGIIFEIQLSRQTNKETYERTIGRALHGYSVCWLFEKDFTIEENNVKLVSNTLKVNSFSEQMHFAKKKFVGRLKEVVEEQCRFLDEKIDETNFKIKQLKDFEENLLIDIIKTGEETELKLLKGLNTREAILLRKIEFLEGNPLKGLVEGYKEQLNNEAVSLTKKLFTNNEILKKNFEFYINELKNTQKNFTPRVIPCGKCMKGVMIFKITPLKNKELYECQFCKEVIWVK